VHDVSRMKVAKDGESCNIGDDLIIDVLPVDAGP